MSIDSDELLNRSRFLGRYELIGALARGGMGSVFLARHAGEAGFHRLFAIKVLYKHLAESSSFVDMLRDEARLAARLHHPNVVPVVDLGTHGQEHYIVMDYVEGPSFSTLWKRSGGNVPRELLVSIIIDTLEGLHAAHILKDDDGEEIRLIHRDVSPSNILVGIEGIARITDFGIAKAERRITCTQPGTRKGKLEYMSPEQIKDSGSIDHRTDIWSIGVVLWNVLVGKKLFRGSNDGSTIDAILNKELKPPSMSDVKTSEGKPPECFDAITMRALERDPEKRYSSALEMADALRKTAAENDIVGSRQQLAAWIKELFGDDLERRRTAIRKVVQRRASAPVMHEASQVTVLPSLPSPPSFQPSSKKTPSSYLHRSNVGALHTPSSDLWNGDLRNRKTLWIALGAIAAIFVSGFVFFYDRSPQLSIKTTELKELDTGQEKSFASPGFPQPDASPVSSIMRQSIKPNQPNEPQSISEKAIDKTPKTDITTKDRKPRRYRRTYQRPQTVKQTSAPAVVTSKDAETPSDPRPKPTPIPEPKPPSQAKTKPSYNNEFEKNPYLMR